MHKNLKYTSIQNLNATFYLLFVEILYARYILSSCRFVRVLVTSCVCIHSQIWSLVLISCLALPKDIWDKGDVEDYKKKVKIDKVSAFAIMLFLNYCTIFEIMEKIPRWYSYGLEWRGRSA